MNTKVYALLLIFGSLCILSCTNSKTESETSQPVESAEEADPSEAEKILREFDSRSFPNGEIKILEIDESGMEYSASRTVVRTIGKDGAKFDELLIDTYNDGGGAYEFDILIGSFGKVQFETDKLVRVERGLTFIGPSLNGHHYLTMDSVRRNENHTYFNLKGEELQYVGPEAGYHASHIEYYRIEANGKIERIVWSDNWNSLDTLPKIKLMYTRNEVFARHGYKFKLSEFQNYFDELNKGLRYTKYEKTYDDVSDQLNSEEKKFVEYVKKLEDKKGVQSDVTFGAFKELFAPSLNPKEITTVFSKSFLDGEHYTARKMVTVSKDVYCFVVSNRDGAGSYIVFTTDASGKGLDKRVVYFSEGGDLYRWELKFTDDTHFDFRGTLDLSLYDDTTDGPLTEEEKKKYAKNINESYAINTVGKITKDQ